MSNEVATSAKILVFQYRCLDFEWTFQNILLSEMLLFSYSRILHRLTRPTVTWICCRTICSKILAVAVVRENLQWSSYFTGERFVLQSYFRIILFCVCVANVRYNVLSVCTSNTMLILVLVWQFHKESWNCFADILYRITYFIFVYYIWFMPVCFIVDFLLFHLLFIDFCFFSFHYLCIFCEWLY